MKVRFSEPALEDIDDIRSFLHSNYPSSAPMFEQRIRTVVRRLGVWPESSPLVLDFPGVRVAALGRFPYRLFHVIIDDVVDILHIHHTSRKPFWEEGT